MSLANESLPLSINRQIDGICDRFEAAWKSGIPPRLESFLDEAPERGRDVLLGRLVEMEVEYRHKGGEKPCAEHYGKRFPALEKDWLASLMSSFPSTTEKPADSPPHGNDHNLLLGILALQVDLVSRDALIAAMHAWVLAKEKSLGQILVEQQALSAEDRKLLENLVNKHIVRHDNDAHKSLASISSIGSLRRELEEIGDPDVLSSVAHVSASPRPHSDPDATERRDAQTAEEEGSRFRNPQFHKAGGLGVVFKAHDQELHRQVALKEIRDKDADSEETRTRFIHEAEITGMLEHPGIVPVYGLGRYANGRPYYAMRFIQGESLKDAIEAFYKAQGAVHRGARSVIFRELLARFVAVCKTIGYAHSRGVLHRDLKPGNIMLGKYGETLVVDWGLAKSVGRPEPEPGQTSQGTVRPPSKADLTPSLMGERKGTPQFMPPEQAEGLVDQMSPRSDVYSLGATLYMLLTGKAPIPGDTTSEALENVKLGKIIPPRQANKNLSAALEAVCLKAMAFQQQDRYASALVMAEDIERWLADQPVTAWREPRRLRVWRWMRHHRAVVMASIALLVTAVVALTISTALVMQEQSKTQSALADTEHVLDTLVQVADDVLPNTPGLKVNQEEPLIKALHLREKFFGGVAANPQVARKLALDHYRVAKVLYQIGEWRGAANHYDRAIALLSDLGSDPEDLHSLALCHNDLGYLNFILNDRDDAQQHLGAAYGLEELLEKRSPDEHRYQYEAARIQNHKGLLAYDERKFQDATDAYGKALDRLNQLAKSDPSNREVLSLRGGVLVNLGVLHEQTGALSLAERDWAGAIDQFEQLRGVFPTKYEDLWKLTIAYNNYGHCLMQEQGRTAERFQEAERRLRDAVALADQLTIDFARNLSYRRELGRSLYNLAEWQMESDMLAEAQTPLLRARDIWQTLVDMKPSTPGDLHLFAETLYNLAWLQNKRQGDDAQALENAVAYLTQAVTARKALLDADKDNGVYRARLGAHYHLLAKIRVKQKKPEAVDQTVKQLLELFRDDAEQSYKCARYLARCVPLAKADLADLYADKALKLLSFAASKYQKADLAGDSATPDSSFYPIVSLPRFQELLQQESARKQK